MVKPTFIFVENILQPPERGALDPVLSAAHPLYLLEVAQLGSASDSRLLPSAVSVLSLPHRLIHLRVGPVQLFYFKEFGGRGRISTDEIVVLQTTVLSNFTTRPFYFKM